VLTGVSDAGQVLTGNDLGNLIRGGAGADVMAGGGGDDVYEVSSGDTVVEGSNRGTDEVRTRLTSIVLAAGVENLTGLSGSGQMLTGNSLANHIVGAAGNDVIDGVSGADFLEGGLGDDVYVVGSNQAIVHEGTDAGRDEVRTTLSSYTLGADLELLTGLSTSHQSLTGNALSNVIRAGSGADDVDGGEGDDVLSGGAGSNRITGGSGIDTASYQWASGSVTVSLGTAAAQQTGQSFDTLSGIENLVGSHFADTLTGNSGVNVITGNDGNDLLRGGDGNDILHGGNGADTLYGENHNDSLYGESGNDNLIGGSGNDTLYGGEGNDQLRGNFNLDAMFGGAGDDVYYVESIGDLVTELAGEGLDTVYTTVSWTLSDAVERMVSQAANAAAFIGTGNALDNKFTGSSASETFYGLSGADAFSAGNGNDLLYGGDGNDLLTGQGGQDQYWGGNGRDIFIFSALSESAAGPQRADVIHDFSRAQLDKVRLNLIDANGLTAQDDAFIFIGKNAFSGQAGELRFFVYQGNTYVSADINGDAVTDFSIRLDGIVNLTSSDFIL